MPKKKKTTKRKKIVGRGFAGYKKGKRLTPKDMKSMRKGQIILNESPVVHYDGISPHDRLARNAFKVTKTKHPITGKGEQINVRYLEPIGGDRVMNVWNFDFKHEKWYKAIKKKR